MRGPRGLGAALVHAVTPTEWAQGTSTCRGSSRELARHFQGWQRHHGRSSVLGGQFCRPLNPYPPNLHLTSVCSYTRWWLRGGWRAGSRGILPPFAERPDPAARGRPLRQPEGGVAAAGERGFPSRHCQGEATRSARAGPWELSPRASFATRARGMTAWLCSGFWR